MTLALAFAVTVASACGGASERATTISKLRAELTARRVGSYLFDRHSGLVGPPEVAHCDPPLVAFRSIRDRRDRHGFATIYVCQSESQAREASVPALPGGRFRSGRVFAVITADAALARDIQAAVRQAG